MMNPNIYKEACVESIEEALESEAKGANRLEYCSDLKADGLTPSFSEIESLLKKNNIPVKVMIRPRAGDFCMDAKELEEMLASIRSFKKLPIAGFVLGVLTKENKIAFEDLKVLAAAAYPVPITFHKAIDLVADKIEALEVLKKIKGVDSVLTSGGEDTAMEGMATLRKMITYAGTDLCIIPAGKITFQNLEQIHELIGAREYHGRRIV